MTSQPNASNQGQSISKVSQNLAVWKNVRMCVNMILFDALKVFTYDQCIHYFTGLMLMDPVDGLEVAWE